MGLFDRLRGHDEQDIDLTEAGEGDTIDLVEEAPEPAGRFGSPTRCPDCGGRGFLDHLDMIDRIQYQHCVECGTKWERTEAQILAGG